MFALTDEEDAGLATVLVVAFFIISSWVASSAATAAIIAFCATSRLRLSPELTDQCWSSAAHLEFVQPSVLVCGALCLRGAFGLDGSATVLARRGALYFLGGMVGEIWERREKMAGEDGLVGGKGEKWRQKRRETALFRR